MGALERIHQGSTPHNSARSARGFRILHIASLAALVLSTVGGVDEGAATKASTMHTGRVVIQAAACVFVAIYVGLAGFAVGALRRRNDSVLAGVPANASRTVASNG